MTVGLLMVAGGIVAGVFGSLLGLGGGVLIVPLLTLGFGLPLREAVGVSLVAVIATSGASAGVYLQRHVANLRLGMTLELFTASGALVGALIAFAIPDRVLAGLFAALMLYVAVTMARAARAAGTPATDTMGSSADVGDPGADPAEPQVAVVPRGATAIERLSGPGYRIRRVRTGIAGSVFAGVISAVLGIGGGIVKVPLMHIVMGVPLRVATATSNLMIGITASSSAIIYLLRGGIDPYVAGPTVLGVFLGATAGSRTSHRLDLRLIRTLFVVVLCYTAWQMAGRAIS